MAQVDLRNGSMPLMHDGIMTLFHLRVDGVSLPPVLGMSLTQDVAFSIQQELLSCRLILLI